MDLASPPSCALPETCFAVRDIVFPVHILVRRLNRPLPRVFCAFAQATARTPALATCRGSMHTAPFSLERLTFAPAAARDFGTRFSFRAASLYTHPPPLPSTFALPSRDLLLPTFAALPTAARDRHTAGATAVWLLFYTPTTRGSVVCALQVRCTVTSDWRAPSRRWFVCLPRTAPTSVLPLAAASRSATTVRCCFLDALRLPAIFGFTLPGVWELRWRLLDAGLKPRWDSAAATPRLALACHHRCLGSAGMPTGGVLPFRHHRAMYRRPTIPAPSTTYTAGHTRDSTRLCLPGLCWRSLRKRAAPLDGTANAMPRASPAPPLYLPSTRIELARFCWTAWLRIAAYASPPRAFHAPQPFISITPHIPALACAIAPSAAYIRYWVLRGLLTTTLLGATPGLLTTGRRAKRHRWFLVVPKLHTGGRAACRATLPSLMTIVEQAWVLPRLWMTLPYAVDIACRTTSYATISLQHHKRRYQRTFLGG